MPELPDLEIYVDRLRSRVVGERLEALEFRSPFVLRTVQPPARELVGETVRSVRRIGKRIVFDFDRDRHLLVHLMRLGRLSWSEDGKKKPGAKVLLATMRFASGTLHLIEMGPKKRAAMHVVEGDEALADFDRGGIEPLDADLEAFRAALTRENHTVKRSLTDPRLFAGIGNAYSDEILHAARLSPVKWTERLDDEEIERLHRATQSVLRQWLERLEDEVGDGFPTKVTAFRPEMAVHGKYGEPCPECGAPVQRIKYADRETNYCAQCQTGGRPLADRGLSRLLGKDWPKTLEELEERRQGGKR